MRSRRHQFEAVSFTTNASAATGVAGLPSAWPSPFAVIALGTLPVLALLSGPTVNGLLADMPLGRGAAIASIWLILAIVTTALAVIGLLALPLMVAVGRRRPQLLVAFIERIVRVALVGLALIVAGETLLASGVVLIIERLVLGTTFAGSVAIVMFGGFAGVYYLLRAATRTPKSTERVTAISIEPGSEPALDSLVEDLAIRLSVSPPDRVVVGPELTFFVTSRPILVDERMLTGTTLYLSWPVLWLLSSAELSAVVAHELAHVAANHLETGRRLGGGIDRLHEALLSLDSDVHDNPGARIGTQPAAIWLNRVLVVIGALVAVQRQPTELEADRIATDVVDPDRLGAALVMIATAHAMTPVWRHLATDPRATAIDKTPPQAFAEVVDQMLASEHRDALLAARDPWSTHPSVVERLDAIGATAGKAAVADEPAMKTLFGCARAIDTALADRMRNGPQPIRSGVINSPGFDVVVAAIAAFFVFFAGFTLLIAASGNPLGNQLNAIIWGVILMIVVALAGAFYVGVQQEVVIDDDGISATGWFKRFVGLRSRVMPWAPLPRATVGHAQSIRLRSDGRSIEIHGTWMQGREVRRVIEGLRSHEVPIWFKAGAGDLDDERRVVVWFVGDRFLVPTLRRTKEGQLVETEKVRESALDMLALCRVIAAVLSDRPGPIGRRSRLVDIKAGLPDARRIVITGTRDRSNIRIDGIENQWWFEGPPEAVMAVRLIFDVFELGESGDEEDAGHVDDGDVGLEGEALSPP
jgi:Zn-dependent protease with chaperone function